jgi:uncharacterized membrane protein
VIVAAVLCFLAPPVFAAPAFDNPWLLWLGLETVFPRSNDFVPLLPWFGVVLFGIAAARLWTSFGRSDHPLLQVQPPWQLVWLGRWSLVIYLVHQPVLFSLVYLAAQAYPPDYLAFEPHFIESCSVSCLDSQVDAEICRKTCNCVAERAQAEGLWSDLMFQSLSVQDELRYFTLADACRAQADTT